MQAKREIDVLVICSTLNQITNYLMINLFKPKMIYNITYDAFSQKLMNINMKNGDWDEYLKSECIKNKKLDYNCNDFKDVYLKTTEIHEIKNKLKKEIVDKEKNKDIFWHITGGQRLLSLAIYEIVKERENDKLLYIEGNTENLIVSDKNGENCNKEKDGCYKYDYRCSELNFQTVLNLTGFRTKVDLESTDIFIGIQNEDTNKSEEEINNNKENFRNEHKFYRKIYKALFNRKDEDKQIAREFRDALIRSNIDKDNSKKIIRDAFKEINRKFEILKDDEHNYLDDQKKKEYPAGYIFEKITAHRIYDIVKQKTNVIEMATSLKIYFNKNGDINKGIKDEIDIALLTDTGKMIIFECKSGGMSGDNAKSTKYTTYRLAGVFGMPILLTPLLRDEIEEKEKDNLKNCFKALKSAETAELINIPFDELNDNEIIKKLV